MKYRHSFHAGNFADVHKHVTLLALLSAMQRKEKGFACFETHAGRGAYELSGAATHSVEGIGKLAARDLHSDELRRYVELVADFRLRRNRSTAYPGSPSIVASQLRPQDRAVFCELVPSESRLLERVLAGHSRIRIERGDGFERLRAWLPPPERRGLLLLDPPYEATHQDFERVGASLADALQRFATGVFAAWYPIKRERETRSWHAMIARTLKAEVLAAEIWLYPRDSHVALNGSGMLIVNPPYQLAERMRIWLPELHSQLDPARAGGTSLTTLPSAA